MAAKDTASVLCSGPSSTQSWHPQRTAACAANGQAAALNQGRGVANSPAIAAPGLFAGSNAGLPAGVPDPLALEARELPLPLEVEANMPLVGSMPLRFHTAMRSRSSEVSVTVIAWSSP